MEVDHWKGGTVEEGSPQEVFLKRVTQLEAPQSCSPNYAIQANMDSKQWQVDQCVEGWCYGESIFLLGT